MSAAPQTLAATGQRTVPLPAEVAEAMYAALRDALPEIEAEAAWRERPGNADLVSLRWLAEQVRSALSRAAPYLGDGAAERGGDSFMRDSAAEAFRLLGQAVDYANHIARMEGAITDPDHEVGTLIYVSLTDGGEPGVFEAGAAADLLRKAEGRDA